METKQVYVQTQTQKQIRGSHQQDLTEDKLETLLNWHGALLKQTETNYIKLV